MKTLTQRENDINYLRKRREKECFPIINRGKLWYESLTNEQIGELKQWYQDWLNVTNTLRIPILPNWINNKVEFEEEEI